MRFNTLRLPIFCASLLALSLTPSPARADEKADAQAFVETARGLIQNARANDSVSRPLLEGFVAFDEIAIRAFGGLCPVGVAKCVDHWKDLTPAQRTEVVDLLAKLVVKNYRKNHIKGTNEYVTTFVGTTTLPTGELKVKTETKSKTNTREPASTLDYIVKKIAVGNRVIDIVAEGSSMTRNYNDQFHKMLTNPAQGYSHVVKKLKERLAE